MRQAKVIRKEKPSQASKHASHLLLSASAGGLLGAAAALLLTPKSGPKVRQDLYDRYKNLGQAPTNNNSKAALAAGAALGGILGAALVYYLAAKEETTKEGLGQKIKDTGKSIVKNATHWVETAKDVVDDIHEKVHQFDEDVEEAEAEEDEDEEETESTHLNDFIELAQLGLRVWNNLQKRK